MLGLYTFKILLISQTKLQIVSVWTAKTIFKLETVLSSLLHSWNLEHLANQEGKQTILFKEFHKLQSNCIYQMNA